MDILLPLPPQSLLLDRLHRPVGDANRRKIRHGLAVCLRVHRDALLAHRRQHLEVVDVVGRREGVEEFGLFVERVRERVWGLS
jgi:hypothetical protein